MEDDGNILGLEISGFSDSDVMGKKMVDVVINRLGIAAANAMRPEFRTVEGKLICRIYCPNRTEPTFVEWEEFRKTVERDLYIRVGPTSRVVSGTDLGENLRENFEPHRRYTSRPSRRSPSSPRFSAMVPRTRHTKCHKINNSVACVVGETYKLIV